VREDHPVNLASIREAARRIAPFAHVTPVMTCGTLDALSGRRLFLKCENLQKVGAFKFRGACNAIRALSPVVARRGVVTHSSGNHGQAVALAAQLRNIPAHIVMPNNAPTVKRQAVASYGGRIILCAPTLAAREETAQMVLEDTGGTLIHAYNHADVIAGQGTITLELLDALPELDAIIAPIGGGGLISGIAIAAKALRPGIRIFGAEPSGADDAARSKAAGTFIPQSGAETIADGLLTSLGTLTWPVVRDLVEEVITINDQDISTAMQLIWSRAKLVIEPSAAVAVAAMFTPQMKGKEGLTKVAIVLSGGNVDWRSSWSSGFPTGMGFKNEENAGTPEEDEARTEREPGS